MSISTSVKLTSRQEHQTGGRATETGVSGCMVGRLLGASAAAGEGDAGQVLTPVGDAHPAASLAGVLWRAHPTPIRNDRPDGESFSVSDAEISAASSTRPGANRGIQTGCRSHECDQTRCTRPGARQSAGVSAIDGVQRFRASLGAGE